MHVSAQENRFEEIINRINQINDAAKLKELHEKAIQMKGIDGFGFIC